MQAEVLSILQEFRYETSAPGEDEQNNEQASSSEESDAA
jgi:ParB family chromosome partitioning protein